MTEFLAVVVGVLCAAFKDVGLCALIHFPSPVSIQHQTSFQPRYSPLQTHTPDTQIHAVLNQCLEFASDPLLSNASPRSSLLQSGSFHIVYINIFDKRCHQSSATVLETLLVK